jgi:hypothetical protein
LQWHISTTSMRDQYRHFYYRMVRLEQQLGLAVMLRWHDVANYSRKRPTLQGSTSAQDAAYLTWSFQQISKPWGMRAASLPVIYSSIFLCIGLSLGVLHKFPGGDRIAIISSLAWLLIGNFLVYSEARNASRGRRVQQPQPSTNVST